MIVITLLFVIFLLFIKNGVSLENLVYPCQTPDAKTGFCVSIFDCPELIKLVYETDQEGANFAKESICLECMNNNTYVCCQKPRNTFPSLSITKDKIPPASKSGNNLRKRKKDNLDKLNKSFKCCGEQHSDYRLGKPDEVQIDEYPWMVQIKHSRDEPISMRCNGVIIEKDYILTTSKCGFRAKTVILGQYNTNETISCKRKPGEEADCTEPTKELSVEVILHSNKAQDDQYGLTLLKVDESISYSDYIRPICLPLNRTELSTTEKFLKLSGWADDTGNKKEITYSTLPAEQCFNIEEKLKQKVTEKNTSLMCLVANPFHIVPYCAFDSGGPLMYKDEYNKWHLDGLITNSHLKDDSVCSIANRTGIYLTPKLIDFIVSNVN